MSNSRDLRRRILGPYRLSHHPLCTNFFEHVFIIRGRKVCRGCFMQYSGMISSFIIVIIGNLPIFKWWSGLTEIQVGLVLYTMVIPTLITTFVLDNRKIKDIARFLLGASFSITFIQLIFTPDLLIKGWILINFIPGYIYLNKRRSMKNIDICSACNEFNRMPYCAGYQEYADRENVFLGQVIQGGINDPFSLPPDQLDE